MKKISILIFACLFSLVSASSSEVPKKPLRIPGKKTLFQRVITHPNASLFYLKDGNISITDQKIQPFTVFYVYQKTNMSGSLWLEVGVSANGRTDGWISNDKVSEWNQALTLIFTERTGRQPVLFFKNLKDLRDVAASPSPGHMAIDLEKKFQKMRSDPHIQKDHFPLAAIEPRSHAISRDRFYLIPIFDTKEMFEGVKFLKIASIDPGMDFGMDPQSLKTGIVFVIDTTISMKPYIDQTLSSVRKLYDSVETAGLGDKVAFSLVAFRSSIEKTPQLEYVSRVVSDFHDGTKRAVFEKALQNVKEAKVSTHAFNEDAYAGIKTALEQLNWFPYYARVIFLISDAGPLLNDDPYATTGMNSTEVADLAHSKNVKIFAIHLKTPAGGSAQYNNHKYAETQYRRLTGHGDVDIGDLYVPVAADVTQTGVRNYARAVEGVSKQMVKLVKATASGKRLALPTHKVTTSKDAIDAAQYKAEVLGYAMQLDFLGKKKRIQAPKVVTAWVSDMDLVRPDRPSFEVGVLISKNQLSDLYQRLKIIIDNAQRTKRTGARDFFQGILSAAAQLSRDPIQFSHQPNLNLGKLGVLAEFLDDLPYRSQIMRLTQEDWYRLSVGEQQAIIDDLKSKIRRYRYYYDDVSNWVKFGEVDAGESVYRMPLNMLP